METFYGICLGIGLAAACGFRVFVPFLVMSLASLGGHLSLSPGFEWIGSYPALVVFTAATGLEIAGYYVPWVDNLLDTIAAPAATIAGTIVMASAVGDMSPLLRWSLALVAGGGSAGVIQVATGILRAASSIATGGLGNPLISTAEAGGSVGLSLLAIGLPLLAGLVVLGVIPAAAAKVFGRLFPVREPKVTA